MVQQRTILTDDQWAQLIKFYDQGHTMSECRNIWGVSQGTISLKFKRLGKKARPKLVPCRPIKEAPLPEKEEGPSSEVQELRPIGKRKIIPLSSESKEINMKYEEDVS